MEWFLQWQPALPRPIFKYDGGNGDDEPTNTVPYGRQCCCRCSWYHWLSYWQDPYQRLRRLLLRHPPATGSSTPKTVEIASTPTPSNVPFGRQRENAKPTRDTCTSTARNPATGASKCVTASNNAMKKNRNWNRNWNEAFHLRFVRPTTCWDCDAAMR
jgi:hypothetical protein